LEKAPLPPQASPCFPTVKNLRFQRAKLTDCRQGCPHHMARVSKEGLLRGILKKKKKVFTREEKYIINYSRATTTVLIDIYASLSFTIYNLLQRTDFVIMYIRKLLK